MDARGAQGVQVGDHNAQHNVFGYRAASADADGGQIIELRTQDKDQLAQAGGETVTGTGLMPAGPKGCWWVIRAPRSIISTRGRGPTGWRLLPLVSMAGTITSPYRGLSAFGERDVALFFGREAAATEVLERMSRRLEGTGLVVVSGVSGAGKSSLLRAGVLPRLRGAGLGPAPEAASWPCLVFTPGASRWRSWRCRWRRLAGADAGAVLARTEG